MAPISNSIFFFFLMIRRPPRSPLFPSPPLSRSQGRPANEPHAARRSARRDTGVRAPPRAGVRRGPPGWSILAGERSEEHTSELQSQSNLVCRLLLEKKKKILKAYASTATRCSES